jgi:hypothetical protein
MSESPSIFKKFLAWWRPIAAKIAHVQGHLILGLIYILVLAPVACLFRLFGQDVLGLSIKPLPSYWIKRNPIDSVSQFMKRMY